jgi:hypothetical protein
VCVCVSDLKCSSAQCIQVVDKSSIQSISSVQSHTNKYVTIHMVCTISTMQSACTKSTSSKLLLALASIANLGFGFRRGQLPYISSFQIFSCFQTGTLLRRQECSDYCWSLRLYWGRDPAGSLAPFMCYKYAIYGHKSELENFVLRHEIDVPFKKPRVI